VEWIVDPTRIKENIFPETQTDYRVLYMISRK
jgi:hypothetical protein